jgi:phenylalanyl-tRNA synthetase beta chain
VDIEAVKPALLRAVQLLTELADAKFEGIAEAGSNTLEPTEITFRYPQVKRILGAQIEPTRCDNILGRLGYEKLGGNEMAAKFKVPSWRVNDAVREIDLIEEVARINGYDKIAPTLPAKPAVAEISLEERVFNKVHAIMSACGLDEIQTSSLIGKPLLDKFGIAYEREKAVEVANSASEEYSMLRQTLAASVLNCLKYNYDNGQKNFWAYEIGKTYFKVRETSQKDTGVTENLVLAGVITGEIQNSKWQDKTPTDFYVLKGIFEQLFAELGVEKRIKLSTINHQPSTINHQPSTLLHPYRSAEISILGQNPQSIGYFGQLHPILKDKMKLNQDAFLFELDLNAVLGIIKETVPRFKKLAQFPEVKRDIAFVINEDVSYDDIQKVIKGAVAQNIFQGSEVFDVYQGEHVDKGFKSLALRIKMRDENATLTDEIIDGQMKNVREKLQKAYAGVAFRE